MHRKNGVSTTIHGKFRKVRSCKSNDRTTHCASSDGKIFGAFVCHEVEPEIITAKF